MEAKLIVTRGNASKREIELKLPMTVGRGREASLTVAHPTVSRIHCELYELDGALVIRDNNSTNGTFVGNERVMHRVLRPDEELTIGPLTFKVSYPHSGAYPTLEDDEASASADTPDINSFLAETVPNSPTTADMDAEVEFSFDEPPAADEAEAAAEIEDAAEEDAAEADSIVEETMFAGDPSVPADDELEFDFLSDESAAAPSDEVAEEPVADEPVAEAPAVEEEVEFDFMADEKSAANKPAPPAAAEEEDITFDFGDSDDQPPPPQAAKKPAAPAPKPADTPRVEDVEEFVMEEVEETAASAPAGEEEFDFMADEPQAKADVEDLGWAPPDDSDANTAAEEPTLMADDFAAMTDESETIEVPPPATPAKGKKSKKPEKPAKAPKAKRSWWPFGRKKKVVEPESDEAAEEPPAKPAKSKSADKGKKSHSAQNFGALPAEPMPAFTANEGLRHLPPDSESSDKIDIGSLGNDDTPSSDAADPDELNDFFKQLGMKK